MENLMEETQRTSNPNQLLEKEYSKIHQAANDFLLQLPRDNIKCAISLAAALAGLKLLRANNVDLAKYKAGHVILGAVPDETYKQVQRFMFSWALSNGLTPNLSGGCNFLWKTGPIYQRLCNWKMHSKKSAARIP